MVSDSISNSSIPMASSSNHKDFAKKKRANRVAKLKQCKLDARREQWLSQVKNIGRCKVKADGNGRSVGEKNVSAQSMDNIDTKAQNDEEFTGDRVMMHHYSHFESSPPSSPNSHTSSIMGSNYSGINFSASGRSVSSSGQSCSIKSFCSGSMSEEDEVGDVDGCLDDWEAIADALAATDTKQQECITNSEYDSASSEKYEIDANRLGIDILNDKLERGCKSTTKQRAPGNSRAWKPDDAHRPHSLPNLTKKLSHPVKIGGSVWRGCKNLGPAPVSCPICFEDLDYTDWSFLPCSCGFRLCLFCHKKILEGDGRCPGCRKHYEHDHVEGEATYDGSCLTFHLARSCSMVTRS